jgi:hypothetical protein
MQRLHDGPKLAYIRKQRRLAPHPARFYGGYNAHISPIKSTVIIQSWELEQMDTDGIQRRKIGYSEI